MRSDFLMHYGIPGMKWGIRRFQLKGSSKRTEAGKKRYAYDSEASTHTASFNGRKIKLPIHYEQYEDEKKTDTQKKIAKSLKDIDFSGSLKAMRKYIKDNNTRDLLEFDGSDSKIKNPFRYVMPKTIFIPHEQDDNKSFHVLCDYRFDPEHGIAITYENGKVKRVVHQDYVL